ncbi:DNRLRE domain-containing protein [Lysinibacillus sp. NPDC098008]|uniref:DNRLRE domain-containing protein n=1 Tax=Lysinibacillus sp. NPDC098008 TaxID=3364146 RepID=UPI0038307B4C
MEDKNFEVNMENSSQKNDFDILAKVVPSIDAKPITSIEIQPFFHDENKILDEIYLEITVSEKDYLETNTKLFDVYQDILTELEINPNNSFKAKYTLIAVGKLEQETEIVARPSSENHTQAELISRALGINDKDTCLDIMYRGNSDVYTEIQPIGYNFVETAIEVPPHNRMWAIYEVQQPPIVTDIFNPTQDAFTRESLAYQSINYGNTSSMVVGRSTNDIWRSFVQFDLSAINPSYVLQASYLRLYYKDLVPTSLRLEILNADNAWQETNITNLNRPHPIDLISSDFTVNTAKGYIEFDVLKIVKLWVALEKMNNGFIIRLSNETEFAQTTFYTRETILPPELVVEYFDSRIFSQGRSQQLTEIFIYNANNVDIQTEITVDSVYDFTTLATEIYIKHVNNIAAEITPRPKDELIMITEISANKPYIPVEIIPIISDASNIQAEITITVPQVDMEITIPSHDESSILIEIEALDIWTSFLPVEIWASKDAIPAEIISKVQKDKNLQTIIAISKPAVEAEIEVKYRNDIWVEIEPNIKSDIPSEITVTKSSVAATITVQRYSDQDKETEIFIKYVDDINTDIDVKLISQVNTIIAIKAVAQVATEIAVTRRKLYTEITIPTWADADVVAVIEPRILMVNNIHTIIVVNGEISGYAFIM